MMRSDEVISFMRNADTTRFRRKSWKTDLYVFYNKKTNKIECGYYKRGENYPTKEFVFRTKDLFAFDWVMTK